MANKEQLEKIKASLATIQHALSELEKGGNIAFFKSLIQKTTIEVYEHAGTLDQASGHDENKKPHIKIITQTEVFKKSEPEIQKQEPPKPEVHEIIAEHKPMAPEPPAVEMKVQEIPVPEVPVQEIKKPEPVLEKKAESVINIPVYNKEEPKKDIRTESAPVSKTIPAEDDDSLNARLSKSIKPVLNIVEKSKDTPIKDLVKAISVSKKFEFIKVLFGGNSEDYKNTLHASQNAGSYEEALRFLQNNVSNRYDWSSEESEPLAAEFYSLVRRRHIN